MMLLCEHCTITPQLTNSLSSKNRTTYDINQTSISPVAIRDVEHENALLHHSPTNDEINAAESGNPDSPEYRNRPAFEITGDVNAEWQALEAGNPDAQSANRPKEY